MSGGSVKLEPTMELRWVKKLEKINVGYSKKFHTKVSWELQQKWETSDNQVHWKPVPKIVEQIETDAEGTQGVLEVDA